MRVVQTSILFFSVFTLVVSVPKLCALSARRRDNLIKEHPLEDEYFKTFLDTCFAKRKQPWDVFVRRGWTVLKQNKRIIVARHEDYPQYVCKAQPVTSNEIRFWGLDDKVLSRVRQRERIARELEKGYVRRAKLDKLIVLPKKWIYTIPDTDYHVVIAEYIDIITDKELNKASLETIFTPDQVNAMLELIENALFWDGHSGNLCVTNAQHDSERRVAIIDTEDRKDNNPIWGWISNLVTASEGKKRFARTIN